MAEAYSGPQRGCQAADEARHPTLVVIWRRKVVFADWSPDPAAPMAHSDVGLGQPQRQLHELEGAAVLRGHPVALDCRVVLGGAIALVAFEAIVWILARKLDHHGVTHDFGYDGGRGDGEALGVALHDCAARAFELGRHLVAVNEH